MAFNLSGLKLALFAVCGILSIDGSPAARQLLQKATGPNLPKPSWQLTPTIPSVPQPTLFNFPTGPTLPQPTMPNGPIVPKLGLPPLSAVSSLPNSVNSHNPNYNALNPIPVPFTFNH